MGLTFNPAPASPFVPHKRTGRTSAKTVISYQGLRSASDLSPKRSLASKSRKFGIFLITDHIIT